MGRETAFDAYPDSNDNRRGFYIRFRSGGPLFKSLNKEDF